VSTVKHLQNLSVYVPHPVSRLVLENPYRQLGGTWRRFHAVTVFADISGFTPLAEALASEGSRGTEELTSILNRIFEALITAAEASSGHVVKFGGDALSLIWPCEPENSSETAWHALQAAFDMQAAMTQFATVTTKRGNFDLLIKIGLSVGELLEVHIGGVYDRWEYVLAGQPIANMGRAENLAKAGQIVVDEATWQLINGRDEPLSSPYDLSSDEPIAFGDRIAPGFYRILHLWSKLKPCTLTLTPPDWSGLDAAAVTSAATTLQGYIPGAISSILENGHIAPLAELKPMTICFVGFGGIDYDHDPEAGQRLNNFVRDAQQVIYHYEGSINKLGIGDKGSVLLVLFGAPPFFHQDDEVRGVTCAIALRKVAARHQLNLRIGLTAGPIVAGTLGSPRRREYTVVGDIVNLSARLMQNAGSGEVWVDQSVERKSNRHFEFEDLGDIQVKGKTQLCRVYRTLQEKQPEQDETMEDLLIDHLLIGGRE
jgi:class 3 adenylate cyclase